MSEVLFPYLTEVSIFAGGSLSTILWTLWARRTGIMERLSRIERRLDPAEPDSVCARLARIEQKLSEVRSP